MAARRALKDEMPGMVFRGITRAIAKGVLQNELQKRGGLIGGLIGAARLRGDRTGRRPHVAHAARARLRRTRLPAAR